MKRFFDTRQVFRAALAGAGMQGVVALAAHFSPFMADHLFIAGRLMCAAATGVLYGFWIARLYALGALGGAVAAGIGALPVIALSVLAGDSPAATVATGTGFCMFAGGAGGAFGHFLALRRKIGL